VFQIHLALEILC